MRHLIILLVLVLVGGIFVRLSPGGQLRIAKGDYDVEITTDGLEANYKGIRFICGSRVNISRPAWTGTIYSGHNLPASKTAKLEATDDRIVIIHSIPGIRGRIVQEIRLDESGLLISAKLQVAEKIAPSPVEYTPAIFTGEVFAGGRYRATCLLGCRDWQSLSAEKPTVTGSGTYLVLNRIFGMELENKGVTVSVESLRGPTPSFYDMRSREYPPAEKNYWLLYSFQASKGGLSVQTRISAKSTESQTKHDQAGKVFILDDENRCDAQAIGETFFSGDKLPSDAWRVKFPKSDLSIIHEFDRAQVGAEFFNLELFSQKRDLAPGERIRINHRYLIGVEK